MANTFIQYPTTRRGFTLTELMVSIALVLILLLAINIIFDMTAKTIGGGQALSTLTRDGRSAESAMADDFKNILSPTRQPVLAIWSAVEPKFANANDKNADIDCLPATVDVDEDGNEGETSVAGENLVPTVPNTRMHRTDMTSFFASGRFTRVTGTANAYVPLVDSFNSREAWVQYGHSVGTTADTGAGVQRLDMASDDDNFEFANNWTLARTLVLLGNSSGTGGANAAWQVGGTAPNLTPITKFSQDSNGEDAYLSRTDVANTSIDDYLAKVRDKIAAVGPDWAIHATDFPLFRVEADGSPVVNDADGITNFELARAMPVFLQGCTQFIVEYAGDFLSQDPLGMPYAVYWDSVTSNDTGTDNEIDYIVDTVSLEKRIRWYGLPRDSNGDGAVTYDSDVVPLRDLWSITKPGECAPFERFPGGIAAMGAFPFASGKVAVQLANPAGIPQNYSALPMLPNEAYYCVWEAGMRRPKLIRITVTIVDPNNRLSEGQTYQYIFKVPE